MVHQILPVIHLRPCAQSVHRPPCRRYVSASHHPATWTSFLRNARRVRCTTTIATRRRWNDEVRLDAPPGRARASTRTSAASNERRGHAQKKCETESLQTRYRRNIQGKRRRGRWRFWDVVALLFLSRKCGCCIFLKGRGSSFQMVYHTLSVREAVGTK